MPRQGPEALAAREIEINDMRVRILGIARMLARSKGWEAVSVRAIGEALGTSAGLIYTYFRDKGAILTELQRQSLRDLGAHLQGQSSVVEMSLECFDLAASQPEQFELLTGRVEGCNAPGADLVSGACQPVIEHYARHPLPGLSAEEAFVRWWSVTFGFILSFYGGLTGGVSESREMLRRVWM